MQDYIYNEAEEHAFWSAMLERDAKDRLIHESDRGSVVHYVLWERDDSWCASEEDGYARLYS